MRKARCLLAMLIACVLLGTAVPGVSGERTAPGTRAAAEEFVSVEDAAFEVSGDLEADEAPDEMPGEIALDLSGDLSYGELPETGLLEGGEPNAAMPGVWSEVYYPSVKLPNNRELLAGYIDSLFRRGGVQRNGIAADQLTGLSRDIYDYLAEQIGAVAAGERSDTTFYLPLSLVDESNLEEAMANGPIIIDVLLADHPYELYWYNREAGWGYEGSIAYFSFKVADDYGVDTYKTDSTLILQAQAAAENARNVVKSYEGLGDYDKLLAYKDYIQAATGYNYDAAAGKASTGNPWQLVWVFDGDDSTTVVCEGYSKAFQYLCDMSSFRGNTLCYSVTGYMGGEDHMWNIVHMPDGKNYMADITNDRENARLFLTGYESVQGNTYFFRFGDGSMPYTYDDKTLALFPQKALTLSDEDYVPSDTPVETVTPKPATTPEPAEINLSKCTFTVKNQVYTGKALKPAVTVKYGKATLEKGTDYAVSYTDNRNVGTATVTVKGKGGFTGTKKVTFAINPAKVSKCTFTVKDQVYSNGKARKPAVTVKFGRTTLKKGTDYTVSYTNNKAVGTATATVKGRGNFTGTKKVTFRINPKGLELAELVAGKKKLTVKWKQRKNITGYQVRYGLKADLSDGRTVTIARADTTETEIRKLKAKKKYYVCIRAYETVSGRKYFSAWSKVRYARTN